MIGWLLRHPLHAGILTGLLTAVIFGIISFPGDGKLNKTVEDWLPEGAAQDQDEIDRLISALEDARATGTGLVEVSESEFRDLDLARSHAVPGPGEGGTFEIEYVGQAADDDATVYVASWQVHPAPWWHPDRLLYRAASYHVDRFTNGLTLTYERDWDGLGAVLLLDAIVGVVYGGIIGLIVSLFGTRDLTVPVSGRKRLPAETPPSIFRPDKLPRSLAPTDVMAAPNVQFVPARTRQAARGFRPGSVLSKRRSRGAREASD